MSLYSFIAFPREVNTRCLKSRIDKSKIFKVKDLKGTEWAVNYIGLPDDEIVYIGDLSDLDELQIYERSSTMLLENVFINQFIYSMNAIFKINKFDILDLIDINKRAETAGMNVDEYIKTFEKDTGISIDEDIAQIKYYLKQSEGYIKEVEQKNINYVARCRQQLYELVKFNTIPGEVVEIFSGLVCSPNPIKFDLPIEKRVINLEEVLTSELIDMQDKLKIEIRNTGDGSVC